jgi:hypothetical protein
MDTPPNDPEGLNDPQPPEAASSVPGEMTDSSSEAAGEGAPSSGEPQGDRPPISENLPPIGGQTFGNPHEQIGGGTYSQPPPGYANYPRLSPTGYGPIPPAPAIIRFGALEDAWNLLKQDLGSYAGGILVLAGAGLIQVAAVLIYIVLVFGFPFTPDMARSSQFQIQTVLVSLPFQVLLYPLNAGYFWMCLKRLRGEKVEIKSMFEGYRAFGPLALQALLLAALGQISQRLFYAPFIVVYGCLAFAPLIAIDQKAGAFESVVLSITSLKGANGSAWLGNILLMGILTLVTLLLVVIPGICSCGIGLFFLMPIYYLVIALHYHAFFPPQGGPQQVAPIVVAPQYSV